MIACSSFFFFFPLMSLFGYLEQTLPVPNIWLLRSDEEFGLVFRLVPVPVLVQYCSRIVQFLLSILLTYSSLKAKK